jgi:SAM-dependent methyltransferase
LKKKERNLLHPSLWDYYYLEGFGRVEKLRALLEKIFREESNHWDEAHPALLLDLGGRESPYEELARGFPVRWVSADLKRYRRTEICLDGERLPFREKAFDLVLCTQVFGYVPDLCSVTGEIHRVLKPGGQAILTEASVFPPWGEGARWRILPEGWRTILRDFSACQVQAELSTAASFFRVVNLYLAILLKRVFLLEKIGHVLLCPLFNLLGRWMNRWARDDGFTSNYLAIGRK